MTQPSQSVTAPKVGTFWIWEIGSPHARTLIKVDDVDWNGEEWWVHCRKLAVDVPIAERPFLDESGVYGNELDRFWEAVTPVGGRRDDLTEERTP